MFHHFLYRMTHLAAAASPPPTKSHVLGVHPSIAGMWLLWNALTLEFYTSRHYNRFYIRCQWEDQAHSTACIIACQFKQFTPPQSTLDGSRTHKILSLNQAPMPIRLQGQKKCGFSTYLDKKTAKLTHFCFPVSATSSFYATSNVKLAECGLRDSNSRPTACRAAAHPSWAKPAYTRHETGFKCRIRTGVVILEG